MNVTSCQMRHVIRLVQFTVKHNVHLYYDWARVISSQSSDVSLLAKMLRVKFKRRFIVELFLFHTRLYTIGLHRAYVCRICWESTRRGIDP